VKLRLRGNSIRLRLTQGEVAALREQGSVEETVHLAPMTLTYRIERSATAPHVTARFDGRSVVVEVPEPVVHDFCETDRVGFEHVHGDIRVLVEKDWQCLAPRGEDESDAFPHPKSSPHEHR
jgi:hypothetical protein